MKALGAAIFIGAAPFLMGASAADPRAYETEWEVTQETPAELLAAREVSKNMIIFQQNIRFAKLSVSDVAVKEAGNSEEFVPAGEQFYRAATEGPELWCTANMKMPQDALRRDLIGRVYSQYCILDANRDGVFDSFFKRARTIEVLPTVRGKITPTPRPINPLKLTQVDPNTLRTPYYIGLVYFKNHGKPGGQRPQFQRYAGSEHGRFLIETPFMGTGGENQTLSVEGAEVRYSVQPAGLNILSVKPFASGSVRIKGTNCGLVNGC